MELDDIEFFTDHVFKKIQQVTGEKLELNTVYAGGNTYGTSGDIHIDNKDKDTRLSCITLVQTYGDPCGAVRLSSAEGQEPIYKEFHQTKVYTLNQTSPTWESPLPSTLRA